MPESSVLQSVKKVLNLDPSYVAFDQDIMMHINSIFSTLHQLGVGPADGFTIEDSSQTWEEFIVNTKNIYSVKSYMYLKVRLLFDPPATSFALDAMKQQATEFEWRLNVAADNPITPISLTSPGSAAPNLIWDLTGGLDFPPEAPIGAKGIDLLTGDVWRNV